MRTILISGILALALSGAGCSGLIHETHPEYAHQGARNIGYGDGDLSLNGRHAGPPEGAIRASGDAYATRTDADSRQTVATAEAGRIYARTDVTAARARVLNRLWEETRACRNRGYDLVTCLGGVTALALLSAEEQSYLLGLGGYAGRDPWSTYFTGPLPLMTDSVAGAAAAGREDTEARLEALEGAVVSTAATVDTYVRAADAEEE